MYNEAISLIEKNSSFLLILHIDPDGDTIGSSLALREALLQKGKHVSLFCKSKANPLYNFLTGFNEIQSILPENLSSPKHHPEICVISIDCADEGRLGVEIAVDINLDHHLGNPGYAKINIIEPSACATGEIIYRLLLEMKAVMNSAIADGLYTAILTDTGQLAYENTTAKTFEIMGELVKAGASPSKIANHLYEQLNFEVLKSLGQSFIDIEQSPDGRIVWAVAEKDKDSGPRNVIDYIRQVKTAEIALVFKKDAENKTKVSLRSKGNFDVRQFAAQFKGGGHPKAAGCTIELPLAEAQNLIISHLTNKAKV